MPGRTGGKWGCTGWGGLGRGFSGCGSFQYGAETEKLQQQLASEKEIQMQLQDEVRLPRGSCPRLGVSRPLGPPESPERTSFLQQGLGLSLNVPSVTGTGPGRWQFRWGLCGVVPGVPCMLLGASRIWLPSPLGREWAGHTGLGAPGSQRSLRAGSQLQDLREKYTECGGMLIEAREEVKTLRQQAPVSTGSVTHYTYTVPLVRTPSCRLCLVCPVSQPCWPISSFSPFLCLAVWAGVLWGSPANVTPCPMQEALPSFQETLAEELRTSIRRIISDPVFFMERYATGPQTLA